MKLSDFLSGVGRQLAFYPSLVKAIGNRNDTIFICQMAYWKDKGEDPNGWIYKESSEIEEETSLTYKEQIGVRKRLKKRGLLQEKYFRSIHRIYFRINWEKVNEIWEDYEEIVKKRKISESEVPAQRSCATCPTVSSLISNTYSTSYILPLQKNCKGSDILGGKEMCEKCEYHQKCIEDGEKYGLEESVDIHKKLLSELKERHNNNLDENTNRENRLIQSMFKGNDIYAERISDYPEVVRKHLLTFVRKFNFPPMAIPKKSRNKGGMFATWINGMTELIEIAGEKNFELVLDKAYEKWYSYEEQYRKRIDMPQKFKAYFTEAVMNISQEKIAEEKEIAKKKEIEKNKPSSSEFVKNTDVLKDISFLLE